MTVVGELFTIMFGVFLVGIGIAILVASIFGTIFLIMFTIDKIANKFGYEFDMWSDVKSLFSEKFNFMD